MLVVAILCCAISGVYGKDWVSGDVEITFRVVDDKGVPVPDARVSGYFWSPHTHNAVGDQFDPLTNTNGACLVAGKGYGDMYGQIRADGHYRTEFSVSLGDKVEAKTLGVWPLKNPVVTLKAMRNPIPMYAKRDEVEIPEQNKSLGFDFEKGDWVAPYGMGVIADLHFFYSLETKDLWTGVEQFEIANTNLMCGVQETEGDTYSTFISKYEAPAEGFNYRWNDILNRTKTKVIERKKLAEENYLIFRSRAVVDSQGKLVRANYGKIYPPIKHGVDGGKAELSFTYYFNPIPNDRNLEFDPDKNLFGGRENFAP